MKKAIVFIMAMFIIGTVSAQQSVEKTLIKPVNLKGNTDLDLNLNGKVEVKKWNNDYAQVEIGIKAYGINSTVLKSLVAAGRYNIKVEYNGDKVQLSTYALAKTIKVRGQELKDQVTFTIFVPEYTVINNVTEEDMSAINQMNKPMN